MPFVCHYCGVCYFVYVCRCFPPLDDQQTACFSPIRQQSVAICCISQCNMDWWSRSERDRGCVSDWMKNENVYSVFTYSVPHLSTRAHTHIHQLLPHTMDWTNAFSYTIYLSIVLAIVSFENLSRRQQNQTPLEMNSCNANSDFQH